MGQEEKLAEKWIDLRGLITSEEIEGRLGGLVSKERIDTWADIGVLPHYLLEDDRLFLWDEVQSAINKNLLIRREANPVRVLPLAYALPAQAAPVPDEISRFSQHLVRMPIASLESVKWPGIYFLCHNGKVVYVGQTGRTVARRVHHHCESKVFDSAFCIRLDPLDLNYVESELIKALMPTYNLLRDGVPCLPKSNCPPTEYGKELLASLVSATQSA